MHQHNIFMCQSRSIIKDKENNPSHNRILACMDTVAIRLSNALLFILSGLRGMRLQKVLEQGSFLTVIAALCLGFILLSSPAKAASVFCKNCSTNVVQMLEKMESAQQLAELYKQVSEAVKQTQQQIQLVQTTFNQYQNMIQNTAQLPQSVVNEMKGKLTELAKLTSQLKTQRGDLTSMGQIFNELFPGQELFEGHAAAKTPEAIAQANAQYRQHWDEWSAKVDQAAKATFQLSGQQLDEIQQDSAKFQSYLDSLLATPDGQMKALMAGNQLSAMQIQEARQLRELMATTVQSNLQSQMKAEKESQMSQELWREVNKMDNLEVGSHRAKKFPDPF